MKVLVIGGTHFLGRHFVQQYVDNFQQKSAYKLTLFNRGKSAPNLFNLETIKGDREKDFDIFDDGFDFDVVIDFCGQYPCSLEKFIQPMLKKQPHYLYISSCSVYDHEKDSTSTQEDGLIVNHNIDPNSKAYRDMSTYGARKFLCEEVIRKNFKKHTILRPGLIVGSYDSTFRFPYWIKRLHKGGEILAPGDQKTPIQFIDAHDIATWLHHLIENPAYGDFNVNGAPTSFGEFFNFADDALGLNSEISYVPESFLKENEVGCWMEVPLWIYSDFEVFVKRSSQKAINAGLKIRPLKQTIQDTSQWLNQAENLPDNSYNLSSEKEKDILEKYKKETSC